MHRPASPKSKSAVKLHPTRIDLSKDIRAQMTELLNQQLADTFDLMSQTKQAHWNVKGMHFIGLHKLFDELAEIVEKHIDQIAERCTALGGAARGTVRMSAQESRLDEFPAGTVRDGKVLEVLIQRYSNVGKTTRKAIDTADDAGDADTADLFTEVSRDLDEALYFLESHVQGDDEETKK